MTNTTSLVSPSADLADILFPDLFTSSPMSIPPAVPSAQVRRRYSHVPVSDKSDPKHRRTHSLVSAFPVEEMSSVSPKSRGLSGSSKGKGEFR